MAALVCVAASAVGRLPTDENGLLRRGIVEIEAAGLDGFVAIPKIAELKEDLLWKSLC